MIRKDFHEGIGYSVVEFDGIRLVFAAALPSCGETFQEQAEETLNALNTILRKEGVDRSVAMQTVFLERAENQAPCRRMMREFYEKELPATAYILQPPCEGYQISIEAWGIAGNNHAIEIHRISEEMVLARFDGITWAFLANLRAEAVGTSSVFDRALSTLQSAGDQLQNVGLQFDDVFRTWLYLGGITAPEGKTSRYLELNRARTDYYRKRKFIVERLPPEWSQPVFPASTGIGTQDAEIVIGGIALKTGRPDVVLFPLENPKQTAAYDYAHQYGIDSPKFSRAMAIAMGDSVATLISGTASITASDTRYADNFERQTHQTLDNIEILISPENFQRQGFPGMGATLDDLALVRIYLKRPEDYGQARAICQKRLGKLPAIYVAADICRPELLVEIEGIAFSRRQA
jgi:enamine deaminase RidA (YjgF/YER057c/UK114 family)